MAERTTWHRRIDWIEPIEAAFRCRDGRRLALLDSAMTFGDVGRFSYLAFDPFGVFTARDGRAFWNGAPEEAAPLDALRRRLSAYAQKALPGLPPFQGGAIGTVAYDFGWCLEGRRSPWPSRCEDLDLAFYDAVVAWDHEAGSCWLLATGEASDASHAARRLDDLEALLRGPSPPRVPLPHIAWTPARSRAAHCAAVERVRAFILDGDVYQANVAQRFAAAADVPPLDLYGALREANPAPFAAYLDLGSRQVLSTSPELFLRLADRRVETRPIKGTVRRRPDPDADRAAAAALAASRKDRAENVMIVDLLRNDLSRVCETQSVDVPALCAVETYAGLHHLVSVVRGSLRAEADALDLLAATFPGGSITGAPKLRAMEIVAEIEGEARGVYCGSIGYLGFDGSAQLSIAIRTVVAEGRDLDLRTGGGITLLSDPAAEYEETLVKAQRIFAAGETRVEAVCP